MPSRSTRSGDPSETSPRRHRRSRRTGGDHRRALPRAATGLLLLPMRRPPFHARHRGIQVTRKLRALFAQPPPCLHWSEKALLPLVEETGPIAGSGAGSGFSSRRSRARHALAVRRRAPLPLLRRAAPPRRPHGPGAPPPRRRARRLRVARCPTVGGSTPRRYFVAGCRRRRTSPAASRHEGRRGAGARFAAGPPEAAPPPPPPPAAPPRPAAPRAPPR